MPIVLAANSYGKSRVRVVKVTRRDGAHDLAEISVNVQFEGEFDAVHTAGDNTAVLPTDTMKNTVNALAKTWSGEQIEEFACQLAEHFLADNKQVSRVRIEIGQTQWIRIDHHAFVRGSEEKPTTEVVAIRGSIASGSVASGSVASGSIASGSVEVKSGIENLVLLKTTGSAFEGYKKDRFTTLKETSDRLLATAIKATWTYRTASVAFGPSRHQAREAIVKTFIERESPSVQHTANAMGEAVLQAVPDIADIRLTLPNKHCLLVDLGPLGLENPNEIFVPTDEPHGLIEVYLKR